MDSISKDQVKQVTDGLLGVITEENVALYKKLADEGPNHKITGATSFYENILFPFENYLNGFIQVAIGGGEDVENLLMHGKFVQVHLERLFERFEGSPCSADKARTILDALFSYYKDGEPIEFNYTQEYIFHLPKIILRSQDEIVDFYQAVIYLLYGSPERYFKFWRYLMEKHVPGNDETI